MERKTDLTSQERSSGGRSARGLEVYGDRRAGGTPPAGHLPEVLTPLVNRMPSPLVTRNMMRRQADRGLNLVTLLALLLKRRWLVAGVFTLLFLPVVAYVVTAPPKYEAEVKLILNKNRTEAASNPPASASGVGEAEVAAEIELLRSREIYDQVVRQLALAPKRGNARLAQAEAVRQVEANLKIQPIGKTNIISLRNTSSSPQAAADVPNLVADLYLKKHAAVHGGGEVAGFFQERTAYYQRQLEDAQRALTHFRQTGDVSLINEQKQAYLRRANDLKASLEEADGQARDAEVRLSLLAKQRSAQPLQVETGSRTVRTSALAERLKGTLLDLQNKRAELLTKYDPQYRLVKEVDQQLTETRAALERESQPQLADSSQAPNPLRQTLEAESLRLESQAAGLRARRNSLAADLTEYRGRQARLEEMTANHNDLERSVKIAEENYLLYQRKLEEARLGEALDRRRILNVSVLERAEPPVLPATQHRTYLLLFGLFSAGFGALGVAFVADYLERNLPARAPAGGQRASDQAGAGERGVAELSVAGNSPPQYFRRRDVPPGPVALPTVVEVESKSLAAPNDAWRELFEKRSRTLTAHEVKNGTRG